MRITKLANFSETDSWTTEMNLISAPGCEDVVDIRQKKKDGSCEGRGITLSLEDLRNLVIAFFEWEEEGGCLAKFTIPPKTGFSRPKHKILERIAVLGKTADQWNKELNVVSFCENAPKFDIREWLPDYSGYRNGKTFTESEMQSIAYAYECFFGQLPHKKEHWWE
jgi:hypothetical protein